MVVLIRRLVSDKILRVVFEPDDALASRVVFRVGFGLEVSPGLRVGIERRVGLARRDSFFLLFVLIL